MSTGPPTTTTTTTTLENNNDTACSATAQKVVAGSFALLAPLLKTFFHDQLTKIQQELNGAVNYDPLVFPAGTVGYNGRVLGTDIEVSLLAIRGLGGLDFLAAGLGDHCNLSVDNTIMSGTVTAALPTLQVDYKIAVKQANIQWTSSVVATGLAARVGVEARCSFSLTKMVQFTSLTVVDLVLDVADVVLIPQSQTPTAETPLFLMLVLHDINSVVKSLLMMNPALTNLIRPLVNDVVASQLDPLNHLIVDGTQGAIKSIYEKFVPASLRNMIAELWKTAEDLVDSLFPD